MGKGRKLSAQEKEANAKAREDARQALKAMTPAEKAEVKRQNFIRLANQRVTKVMNAIGNIGNLSSPSYSYTDEDVAKIFGALRKVVGDAEARFSSKPKEKKGFSL